VEDQEDPLGVPPLARFSAYAVALLESAREEIDALNVYPVPDGDTGTNLFLTFEAAHEALAASLAGQGGEEGAELAATVPAYSRGLLLGARGNSGVIMSQMVGALLRRICAAGSDEPPAVVVADGLAEASEAAYAAVGEPVEGTMLSVARAASEAVSGRLSADPAASLADVFEEGCRAARKALARTPEQLEVLRNAGVVDAGGRGLCLVLDAAEAAYTGRRLEIGSRRPLPVPHRAPADDLTEGGPAYEVMYLLDAPDDAIPALRATLAGLGDSLVVVGGEGLWNVHVHVDDVGAAVEAGITAGRPHRVRVTHFAEQVASAGERSVHEAARQARERTGRAVVVLAYAGGLAELFARAGDSVRVARSDRRPSTGELLEAIRSSGACEVIVVPNDRDVVPTAVAAARLAEQDDGIRVAVIPTHAQVQGLAALAVHDPGRPFEQDLVEMSAAARHARSGAVTVAARRAITTAGQCEPGDVLGAVEGDFAVVGDDLLGVALDVIHRMLGGGGELFTIISGVGGEELAGQCAAHLAESYPMVDVAVYDGGQERYPLLFGVE
jgi:uncharacterized protein